MPFYGSFCLVLHGHLPYVLSHGTWPHGTDWLSEATAETYLPLLRVFHGLLDEGVRPACTLGLTPILTEQLAHPGFAREFQGYLAQKIAAARKDKAEYRSQGGKGMASLAEYWEGFYLGLKEDLRGRYRPGLPQAFKSLQDGGAIEIITCAATHGYLPLLGSDLSVQAQIKQGIAAYERHFGRKPRGIWLPECAYRPRYEWRSPIAPNGQAVLRKGLDEFLSENHLDYFIVDSHLLKGGKPIGVYLERFEALKRLWTQFSLQHPDRPEEAEKSPHDLFWTSSAAEGGKPVAVFARDPKTGLQVWSGEWGYPGDPQYLEFHKKKFPGGLRYWRVTQAGSDLGMKEPYDPERVKERVAENADHFAGLVKSILKWHYEKTGRPGVLCAPYDAELFGHWWFEGPEWIGAVMRRIHRDGEIKLATASEALSAQPPRTVVALPEGSWGEGGFHYIWLNDLTRWTWKYIYDSEARMEKLARKHHKAKSVTIQRLLKQAGRELLLLEASDWQFLITTLAARDYAETRFLEHVEAFNKLADSLEDYAKKGRLAPGERRFLEECEERDDVFPDLDPAWFAKLEHPAIT
jgi:1,4-alpha-glucan branching enzyme